LSDRAASEDAEALKAKWDLRHAVAGGQPEPAAVLSENLHLLPNRGRALDLACGLGANATLLARHGFEVAAWDLSPVAVSRVREVAGDMNLPISAEVRDVCARPPEPGTFDCIVVAYFLERSLAPKLVAALRPGGLLFYQTFSRDSVSCRGPANPQYRLATNELLRLLPGLILRFYREEGRAGDLDRGTRDLVQFIGQKSPGPIGQGPEGGHQIND
jgi:tellurite methyltransferase